MGPEASTNGAGPAQPTQAAREQATAHPAMTQRSGPPPMMGRGGPPMGLMMDKAKGAEDTRGTLLHLWRYLAHRRLGLIATAVMIVFSTGLNLLWPYLMGIAIDSTLARGDMGELARICAAMLACFVLISVLTWLQLYIMAGVAQETVAEIRRDLFARLQLLPLRVFDGRSHGELMSRLTNDVENINMVLSESLTQLMSGVLTLVGVTVFILWVNPILALVVLLSAPPMMLLLLRFVVPRTRAGFRDQ